MNGVPREENLDLCLQATVVRGSAVGTAAPRQPQINLWHVWSRTGCHSGTNFPTLLSHTPMMAVTLRHQTGSILVLLFGERGEATGITCPNAAKPQS